MVQLTMEANERMSLRISKEDKILLLKAATISGLDLTKFVLTTTVAHAREVITAEEQLRLSDRDALRLMELIDSPPQPNAKMIAAAKALAKQCNG